MTSKTNRQLVLGIDLGTSNSSAAIVVEGTVLTITAHEGPTIYGKSFPSYVYFKPDGSVVVGLDAKNKSLTEPSRVVYESKRKMGTKHLYKIPVENKQTLEFLPEQIAAFLLEKIKKDAQRVVNKEITKAIITCPAYFSDAQRNATKDAAKLAKLDVLRLLQEPTAAAFSIDVNNLKNNEKLLVFDIGGGTLDVSILNYSDGILEVIGIGGDVQCGGMDIDKLLIDYVLEEFEKKHNICIHHDLEALQKVRNEVELAKIRLSKDALTNITILFLAWTKEGTPIHLETTLSRIKIRQLLQPLIPKFNKAVDEAMQYAKLKAGDINRLILVGGPSKMQFVRQYIEKKIGISADPDVSPTECVAIGAAKQGAILAGESTDILLLDVTPLTLGIEVSSGLLEPLIEKNTTIPVKKSKTFTTFSDNQTSVEIKIYEGQRPIAKDNHELGTFSLDGIPPAKAGIPKIEVIFDINRDNILTVSAKEVNSNNQKTLKIEQKGKLTDEMIQKMIEEAEKYKTQDLEKTKEITLKAEARELIRQSEKLIEETKEEDMKQLIQQLSKEVDNLKTALESNILENIRVAKEAVSNKNSEIYTSKYRASNPQPSKNETTEDKTEENTDNN